ncbi:upstream stimulatory factor 1 isoform X2 [Nematostella vectensis]|uniref:upstream stimulatory factor 1 isoform X2 n=1 Tax=Nematostella vectensis TaxID=45351 RepID=UPI00207712F6|nr:upstream stimulatory factor 1 isoform X2 [Nematostella vectensis]
MTSLFDPMTTASHSNSPTLDMLDGALDPDKSSLHDQKSNEQVQVSPEPETVTVTISAAGEEHTIVGQQPTAAFAADPNTIQFQYRTDANGQVQGTGFDGGSQQIRVVHVQSADPNSERSETPTNFASQGSQVQTVIQSPFSNGSSPTHHGDSDSTDANRFTYFHSQSDGTAGASVVQAGHGDSLDSGNTYAVRVPVSLNAQPSSPSSHLPGTITMAAEAQTITTVGTATGGFYVMMSPQDVMQSGPGAQRSIAPRTHQLGSKLEGPRGARDEKRRATHNEVERRRRDKINGWITKLAKVVPDCSSDQTKTGQSKGGILAKTVDYITDLRAANARMAETIKDSEQLAIDNELLRQQNEEVRQENAMLRAQLQQHGIDLQAIMSVGSAVSQGS